MSVEDRYVDDRYFEANPTWHLEDSSWKARQVLAALGPRRPGSICEVGCGAGGILGELRDALPQTTFVGSEIAPQPLEAARGFEDERLRFRLADAAEDPERFDVMLIMDVIEHVQDPIGFLRRLRHKAPLAIIHVPLDLSVQSILRPRLLRDLRETVGHVHFFTPETAQATLADAGYAVEATAYTPAFHVADRSPLGPLAKWIRRSLPPVVVVRALGGYSLLVTAATGT